MKDKILFGIIGIGCISIFAIDSRIRTHNYYILPDVRHKEMMNKMDENNNKIINKIDEINKKIINKIDKIDEINKKI